MSILNMINPVSLFTDGLGAVNGVVKTVFGSTEERDQFAANEDAAGMQEYAAEFATRLQRTWFDSLVDGVNRLMRPSAFFTTQGVIIYAVVAPDRFNIVVAGLILIPQYFWITYGLMLGFLFPSRLIEKGLTAKMMMAGVNQQDYQKHFRSQKKLQITDNRGIKE